jgi:hypothetical protein
MQYCGVYKMQISAHTQQCTRRQLQCKKVDCIVFPRDVSNILVCISVDEEERK